MSSTLSHALRDLERWLKTLAASDPSDGSGPSSKESKSLARALDRLNRDLLPRTAGGDQSLVVGIVGPNNAGKSALFNGLIGQSASPSLPTGGATRRLVGAARAELLATLEASGDWTRFELERFDPEIPGSSERALQNASDPTRLLVVPSERLPIGLLLIDTPDFDSIAHENRKASEALLTVADLAIVVVTKHSYQNAEVVHYLKHWLAQGRPWMLVYNEAPSMELARTHAAKLAADVGSPPLEVYAAPHALAVMEGREPLAPRRIDGFQGETVGGTLAEGLFDLKHREALKRSALADSLKQLADELLPLAESLATQAAGAGAVLARGAEIGQRAGRALASLAMPIGPFLVAFRAVMDRRANSLSRGWRSGVRAVRGLVEAVPKALFGKRDPDPTERLRGGLLAAEAHALEQVWPGFYEELARDLGPEARHPSRASLPPDLVQTFDADLGSDSAGARERAAALIGRLPADFGSFQEACEHLVLKAVEKRGVEFDIQFAMDLLPMLPVAAAGAVILTTGGLGADLAAAGAGVLASGQLERLSQLLGSGIIREARRLWERERGALLGEALLAAALPKALEQSRKTAERGQGASATLMAHRESLLAEARRARAATL